MPSPTRHRLQARAASADHGLWADGQALADGPARDTLRRAMQRLNLAEAGTGSSRTAALCHALTEVARALSRLHAYDPAESYLAEALRWAEVMGANDVLADLHCALAEVATNRAELGQARGDTADRVRSARTRSRQHAHEAARLAGHTADAHWEVKVLLRASDVLDRSGEHDNAVQLQQRALALIGLHQPGLPPGAIDPAAQPVDQLTLAAHATLM